MAVSNYELRRILRELKENEMSDQIEIQVTVNGQLGTLADVSLETLETMRSKAKTQRLSDQYAKLPLIEHGDYGKLDPHSIYPRFFFGDGRGGKIKVYDEFGIEVCIDANESNKNHPENFYFITGNIFKDLRSNLGE